MANAFSIACDALFADPNMVSAATFLPKSGGSTSLSVILYAPDMFQKIGTSMIETSSQSLRVKVSSCPLIMPGDQFQIGAALYTVQGEPRRDEMNLTWQVDIYAN